MSWDKELWVAVSLIQSAPHRAGQYTACLNCPICFPLDARMHNVFCSRFLSIYTGSTRLWTRSHKVPLCFSQTSAHSFHSNCHTYTDAIPVFISVRHTHGNLFAFKTDHIRQQIFFINSLLLSLSADLSWPLLCSMHFQCYYTFNDTAVSGFGRSCEELVELHLETGLVINTVVNYL